MTTTIQKRIGDAMRAGDVRAFKRAIGTGRASGLTYRQLAELAVAEGFTAHAFEALCQDADDADHDEES